MDCKVYSLRIQAEDQELDMDMCPVTTCKTVYEEIYTSRVEAIRQAQRRTEKLFRHYPAVHTAVWFFCIGPKGMYNGRRVYHIYKSNN